LIASRLRYLLTASFLSIFLLIIYFIKTQEEAIVKLATFRSGGREKIGLVHSNDSRLFDLATAADRDG